MFELYSNKRTKMLISALIIMEIIISVKSWPCVSPIRKVYSRVNSGAVLQFSADLIDLSSPKQFEVKFHDGIGIKARIIYNPDKTFTTDALSGVSITGDTDGKVVVTLANVQQSNAGVYTMASAGLSTKCNCLYIL
ncbi:uncharacterized protein LOC132725237, partial [Ruditapes philippinarum]|uniref:uncharacterized protein LOC132725237 n=1 Tax=Ruditapes philippinarum TaxID=129788 RepID=UPI00295A8BB1